MIVRNSKRYWYATELATNPTSIKLEPVRNTHSEQGITNTLHPPMKVTNLPLNQLENLNDRNAKEKSAKLL